VIRARLGSIGLIALLASCGGGEGGPPPSQAGDLVISYFQGGPEIGAMLLTISGGPVESVTARSGQTLTVSFASSAPGTTKVIITGTIRTGDILNVRVPDVTLSTSYVARVDQVADNVTFSLLDPTLHPLTIHR
jgi:hypothetical protein